MLLAVAIVLALAPPVAPPTPGAGPGAGPPPSQVVGGRSVTVRDATGGLQLITTIPSSSAFATHDDGATCSFTTERDGTQLSNGTTVPAGTVVTSNYQFFEGWLIPLDIPPAVLPDDILGVATLGTLDQLLRTFTVFCDNANNPRGIIQVPARDPTLDPTVMLTTLRNMLQLQRPTIYTNPVVDRFGGLVVRYPAWLAINDGAWRTQRTSTIIYRGATLLLVAEPRELDFTIEFEPDRSQPSEPFTGDINCIPNVNDTAARGVIPELPELPDQTEPGPNGPCMWTPPGPGTLTITARITYTITFWANGYTQPDTDYTFASTPTSYRTDTLHAVNTKP